MSERVVVVAQTACTSLEGIVEKRKVEVEELLDEVDALDSDIGNPYNDTTR